MSIFLLALATLALSANAVEPDLAIKCEGTTTITKRATKRVTKRLETRTYILSPEKKDVAYWNGEIGKAFPFCDLWKGSCGVTFYPHLIQGRAGGDGPDTQILLIDRREGTFSSIDSDGKQVFEYEGTCRATPIPTADTSNNKF
ncbi:hypothetical protein [Sphingomonas sp. CARO-RG-8B-R24-01]|uniref:hypothetical protein n=1 Tax=Sphingomonas sp. CARO-RG-8B-R24-01 TaxID=2914831 RepID=UPI001F5605F5|nr:hypothetical protein [Sphingomonas sp. CARO-RG-8B-R24-01]